MAIVNMLLRPLTAFFLYKILRERNTVYGGTAYQGSRLGEIFSTRNVSQGRYQDISGAPAQELPVAASATEARTLQKV